MATRAQQISELTGPFFDDDGAQILTPYAKFYIGGGAGSANTKSAYADLNKSVSFTKKALADEGNNIYGDGIYDIEVYEGDPDASGTLQYTLTNRKYVATLGKTSTITSDTAGTVDDTLVLADTSLGDVTYTLVDAAEATGRVIIIKKISSDANTLTVAAPSGQTLDNAASASGTNQNYALIVVSDGANYFGTIGDADTLGGVASSGYLKTDGTNPLENNTYLTGRNAADSANVSIAKVNASDELELGAAGSVLVPTAPLKNSTYITGRNAADSANVNMMVLAADDNVYIENSVQTVKSFCKFTGTGTVTITASFNVDSITDSGTGEYVVNITSGALGGNQYPGLVASSAPQTLASSVSAGAPTATTFPISTTNSAGTSDDATRVYFAAFSN